MELPAFGLADAEHRVEKEVAAICPGCAARVVEVGRSDVGGGRIVEEFMAAYRLHCTVALDADSGADARTRALRDLRARFTGTRFERVSWEVASVDPEPTGSAA